MRISPNTSRMVKLLAAAAVAAIPGLTIAGGGVTVTSTIDGSPDLTVPSTSFSVTVSASGFTSEAPTAFDFRVNFSASDIRLTSIEDLTGYFPAGTMMDPNPVINPDPATLIPDAVVGGDNFVTGWYRHVSGADLGGDNLPGTVDASYDLCRLHFSTTASPAGPIFLEVVTNDRSPRPINAGIYTGAGDNPTAVDPTFDNSALAGLTGAVDSDGDGVRDGLEPVTLSPVAPATNYVLIDSDGDGLSDEQELNYSTAFAQFKDFVYTPGSDTNPRNRDTDGDGFPDGLEVRFPNIFLNGPLVADVLTDADGDGLPAALDPDDNNADTDGDRIADGFEAAMLGLAAVTDPNIRPGIGDLNGDGSINVIDNTILANVIAGNINPANPTPVTNKNSMDLNRDGSINVIDRTILANFIAGNIPLLPVPIR